MHLNNSRPTLIGGHVPCTPQEILGVWEVAKYQISDGGSGIFMKYYYTL